MSYSKEYQLSERYKLSIPSGWYAVAFSNEIKPQQIKPLSILNKEYVLFRTSKGKSKVLEAYCPHQGTHLGYGGVVADNCIVCPFHQWRFNEEGECHEIPNAKRIPALKRNCLSGLPTVENDGVIFCYFHPRNQKPDFVLPDFEKDFAEGWTPAKRSIFHIKTHIHELGENGFDIAHFKPVHHSDENSINVHSAPNEKFMKFKLNVVYPGAGMGLPMTKIHVTTDWTYYCPGVFATIVTLKKFPTIIRQNFYFTPQNNGEIAIRFSLRIKKSSLKGNFITKWLQHKLINFQNVRMVLKNFEEDRPIWENKVYRPTPVLCDADGPILHYRRWAQQFYSDNGPLDELEVNEERILKTPC